MKTFKSITRFSAMVAGFAAAAATAQASNLGLIDTLVKKGYLTAEEARVMSGDATALVTRDNRKTQAFSLGGVVHTQLMHTSYPVTDGAATLNKQARTSNPSVRRAELELNAKLDDKWSASLTLGNSDGNEKDSDSYLQVGSAAVTYTHSDALKLSVGYSGSPFGLENTTSSKVIKTIERSAAARYFDNALKFGQTNVGVFASGNFMDGFYYSGAITRADGNASNGGNPTSKTNVPTAAARLGYMHEHNDLRLNVGAGVTYLKGVGEELIANQQNRALGTELFAVLGYQDFELSANLLMGQVKNGREATPAAGLVAATYKNAKPVGFSLIPSYKFGQGKYEIAALYAYVKTDNLRVNDGTNINTGVLSSKIDRGTKDLTAGAVAQTLYFNKINQLGLFGNWYIMENDVKLTLGYTWTQFKDSVQVGHEKTKLVTHTVGGRLQLLF